MTPSFSGRTATMFPGVRPIIFFAWTPTATIFPVSVLSATTDGSFTAIPRLRTYTRVFAVPRSTAMSRPRNASMLPMTTSLPTKLSADDLECGYRLGRGGTVSFTDRREKGNELQEEDLDCRPAGTMHEVVPDSNA